MISWPGVVVALVSGKKTRIDSNLNKKKKGENFKIHFQENYEKKNLFLR